MHDGTPTSKNMMPKALCSSEAVGLANSQKEALRRLSLSAERFRLLCHTQPFLWGLCKRQQTAWQHSLTAPEQTK